MASTSEVNPELLQASTSTQHFRPMQSSSQKKENEKKKEKLKKICETWKNLGQVNYSGNFEHKDDVFVNTYLESVTEMNTSSLLTANKAEPHRVYQKTWDGTDKQKKTIPRNSEAEKMLFKSGNNDLASAAGDHLAIVFKSKMVKVISNTFSLNNKNNNEYKSIIINSVNTNKYKCIIIKCIITNKHKFII